jgi:hypothetical protein
LATGCGLAKADSSFKKLRGMQNTTLPNRMAPSAQTASASKKVEPALSVAMVYQDPLTRHWAAELWNRVEQLVGHEGVCRQSWKISGLADARVFADAVQAAAESDVLVVSVRDTGDLPADLDLWFEAWLPRRAGRAGALVALIGVPPQPDIQSGRAHAYLETVARRAGLDYLPRERKLPPDRSAISTRCGIAPPASRPMPWPGVAPGCVAGVHLRSKMAM